MGSDPEGAWAIFGIIFGIAFWLTLMGIGLHFFLKLIGVRTTQKKSDHEE